MRKIAIVTGATSGIGKEVVLKLLKEDVNVIGLGRSDEKIEALVNDANPLIKDNKLHIVKGDLSDQMSVKEVANEMIKIIVDCNYQIDYLIHVAGRVTSGYHINKEYHEITFAVNHLAVVQLTYLLMDYLRPSLKSRILVVSSQSHFRANINFDNLETKTYYTILRSYKRSKLYNVLFVKGFKDRYNEIPIYAIDPGLVRTNIGQKNTSKLASIVWNWRSKRGIHPGVVAIHMFNVLKDERFDTLSGAYIKHGEPMTSNPITYKKEVTDKMWDVSLGMLDIKAFFKKNKS